MRDVLYGQIYGLVYGWRDVQAEGMIDGWVKDVQAEGWIDGWVEGCTGRWMDLGIGGGMYGQMDRQMDRLVDGWRDVLYG